MVLTTHAIHQPGKTPEKVNILAMKIPFVSPSGTQGRGVESGGEGERMVSGDE